jgi:hypothetical protein
MEYDRLSRIEVKLDKLAEAVVQLARMEERMVNLFNRMDTYEERQLRVEKKIEGIDAKVTASVHKVAFAERVFWIALTAVAGVLVVYLT